MIKLPNKKNDRTTIPGVLFDMTTEMKKEMDSFMFDYGFMFRYAFNRYLEIEQSALNKEETQKRVQSLEKDLSAQTNYPIRVAKDAVADAIQLVKARHELMSDYFKMWSERYENTKKRYDKLLSIPSIEVNSIKIMGLRNKMERQLQNIKRYSTHIENNTFPSVVFGGKDNFKKLQNKEITKQQWNEFRNGRVSSRGDATKSGNPNLRVIETENGFALQVISKRKIKTGKTFIYEKTILPLYIATKHCKDTGMLKGRKYPEMMRRVLEKGSAYEVEILKRNGKYYVHIIVKDEVPTVQPNLKGFLGVDTNIDGLALCHVNLKGSPVHFEWKGDGGLQYYSSNKRENKIWELAHYVLDYCLKNNLGLVIEDLAFMNNREIGKRLRRKMHQFCYKKIVESLEVLCVRYGVMLIKVKPQYTSVTGRLKYQTRFRVNVHLSAAYVIARRAMGFTENVSKKLLSVLTKKQMETFHEQNEWKQWSILKKRVTNLLKKRKAHFYQWHDYKKDVYLTLNKPKKKKATA